MLLKLKRELHYGLVLTPCGLVIAYGVTNLGKNGLGNGMLWCQLGNN